MSVLMLSPEPPYPLHGGGAYRTASLVRYFARFADVDLILISESGRPALLPPGLVRSQKIVPLPKHSKSTFSRYLRNARRAIQGVPPLIDRLKGLDDEIARAIAGEHYDFGVVEHFWCAPYIDRMRDCCGQTILDLHNVESVLHERCAAMLPREGGGFIAAGHRRFARASRNLESALLPLYSKVLVTSQADASSARAVAPDAHIAVYPNALPWVKATQPGEESDTVVFSGNFEYHPNIDAVRFLAADIWPAIAKLYPRLRLRLVGRGDACIRKFLGTVPNVEVTGPLPDTFPEIAAAQIVLAPLRVGSGTRVKILEAWAAGRPVVATPLAAEGLAARDGDNILLARNAGGFITAVTRLLGEPAERFRLGRNGRHTFEENYTWETVWQELDSQLQVPRPLELDRYTG